MNPPLDSELSERIVQEVIRRLVERGIVVCGSTENGTELVVSDKVVSLATLEGRLVGVKRLVIRDYSIITPSVKDELNDRSIELVRRAQTGPGSSTRE